MPFIHELPNWPRFTWENESIIDLLAEVRYQQGRLLGKFDNLGFDFRSEASLVVLTEDVVKSSEIEGEILPTDQVRSSLANRLGIPVAGMVDYSRHVDGVVEMMLDATQQAERTVTAKRLFSWHAMLFPTGYSGAYKVRVGSWRTIDEDPMQVVSGAYGKERIHFVAPAADRLKEEMQQFLYWFNHEPKVDPILKAAITHLWFVTIHPFDDGNGRIARALTDLQLTRADKSKYRFYSMSSQIRKERNTYYEFLEKTQRGKMDITNWIVWFLSCLHRALLASDTTLQLIVAKATFWNKYQRVAFNERQHKMINILWGDFVGKLTTSKWAKINKCSHDTALRDITELVQMGVLEKEQGGGRSTCYRLIYSS